MTVLILGRTEDLQKPVKRYLMEVSPLSPNAVRVLRSISSSTTGLVLECWTPSSIYLCVLDMTVCPNSGYQKSSPDASGTRGVFLSYDIRSGSRSDGRYQVTSLLRRARATASARLETPSLEKMLLAWERTVVTLMNSRSAIWGLFNPSTISASTSRSRGVRS